MIPEIVYLLCALTSVVCAWLLWRSYRRHRTPLLLWSLLGFIGIALNNVLLFVDLVLVPSIDLSLLRNVTAFAAIALMLSGLIWESA